VSNENELYSSKLISLSDNNEFYYKIENPHKIAKKNNPLCGDSVELFFKFSNELIQEISCQVEGCIICKASTSVMINHVVNKKKLEVLKIKNLMEDFFLNDSFIELETDLQVLSIVKKFPSRVKCVLLCWNVLEKGIKDE